MKKPGYKTTELYVTLLTNVIGLLVLYNVLTAEEAEAWQGVAAVLVPAISNAIYTYGRSMVKSK